MSKQSTLFCGYATGMFAHEPIPEGFFENPFAAAFEFMAMAVHEAGHTVLAYALGEGVSEISVTRTIAANLTGGFSGLSSTTKRQRLNANALAAKNNNHPRLISFAVSTAAGPAAERKYRLMVKLPLRMLGATEDDHHKIEQVEKIMYRNGNRGAEMMAGRFCDLVWGRAQLALEDSTIWEAVDHLAEALNDLDFGDEEAGEVTKTMGGEEVRAIIRAAGVRPGMKLPAAAP
jgi:hypothetical protein